MPSWIKMRTDLLTMGKLRRLSRRLHEFEQFREWMTPGGAAALNGRTVSAQACAHIALSACHVVWSHAKQCGEWDGDDLVLPYMELEDLDALAGVPCIGVCLEYVGWAIRDDENDLVRLPNFREYNVPSNAERSRDWRERARERSLSAQKGALDGDGDGDGEMSLTSPWVTPSTDIDISTDLGDEDRDAALNLACRIRDLIRPAKSREKKLAAQDLSVIRKTAVLVNQGFLPTDTVVTIAERAHRRKAAERMKYFHGALKRACQEHGVQFNAILTKITGRLETNGEAGSSIEET